MQTVQLRIGQVAKDGKDNSKSDNMAKPLLAFFVSIGYCFRSFRSSSDVNN